MASAENFRRCVVRFPKQVLLSLFAVGLLVAPAWARRVAAPTSNYAQQAPTQPAPAATATVSGKITAATNASLSLEVQQGGDPEARQFVINADTKIDGTLAVGAMATVEFRIDNGSQIATHVTVQPGS
jgi:hypothetical protein